jgi:hypothetical protein
MALRTKKPDTLIQQEVLRELKWDTRSMRPTLESRWTTAS